MSSDGTYASAEAVTSGSVGAWEQKPYRKALIGSGVPCPAVIEDLIDDGIMSCDSPLTTRLRGGMDSQQRPIAEYLCETCGAVFVAITVSLDVESIRFDDVAMRDEGVREDMPEIVGIGAALRRGERIAKAAKLQSRALPCDECGAVFSQPGNLALHKRAHEVTT